MHKYRSAAKQAAWYNEENDPPNYNPFRKIRSYEHDRPTLHRAQPLQLSTARSETPSDEEVHEYEDSELQEVLQDEKRVPHASQNVAQGSSANAIEIHAPLDEEQGISLPPRAFASWRSWSQQKLSHVWRQVVLASGSRESGDVKRSVADMGMSVISHAPLGTKGAPFLQIPGRRSRFMVIEYARQDGDTLQSIQESADMTGSSTRSATGATSRVRIGVPLLRFYEKESPRDSDKHLLDDHQTKSDVESLCAELMEHLSSVGDPLQSQRNGKVLTKRSEHVQKAHQI